MLCGWGQKAKSFSGVGANELKTVLLMYHSLNLAPCRERLASKEILLEPDKLPNLFNMFKLKYVVAGSFQNTVEMEKEMICIPFPLNFVACFIHFPRHWKKPQTENGQKYKKS